MSTESEPLTVTTSNFMADVVEASAQTPVLVDFWAPWCAPCRQLMPILDRLAQEYSGRLKLAKVNTDEQQALAQQIGIRSLPTVVLFKDRTAVDHFSGVVPESQIRALIEKHLPKMADAPLERARALKADGDFAGARKLIAQALVGGPSNGGPSNGGPSNGEPPKGGPESISLQIELAELQALEGDLDGARRELERLQGLEPNHGAVKRLAALIEFSNVIASYPDIRAIKERVASNANDLELRHALAVHQVLGGDVEPALATWLDMLRNHRTFNDDLARRSLVLAFELIGDADPIVARTRREMAKSLF